MTPAQKIVLFRALEELSKKVKATADGKGSDIKSKIASRRATK